MDALRLNDAMRHYVRRYLQSHPSAKLELTDGLLSEIRSVREACRADEGGGGMCHLVSEYIQYKTSAERLSVSYLDPAGEVICAGHLVNLLADGSILDSTADQFGEGYDIRLIRTVDEEYGRYRPEFDEDFNPVIAPELPRVWAEMWNGTSDFVAQDLNRAKSGFGWWVSDPSRLLDYIRDQREHAINCKGSWAPMTEERFSLWINEIVSAHTASMSM